MRIGLQVLLEPDLIELRIVEGGEARGQAAESPDEPELSGDYVSRELFKRIIESEEDHIDWLETQLDLIQRVGLENYTQSQIKGESEGS